MINKNFKNLKQDYLFSQIAKKVSDFKKINPHAKLLKLGIGDVTRPLISEVIKAMQSAVTELSMPETFRGYCLEQGYGFLRDKIVHYYKKKFNVAITLDEVFISDGAKSDLGNILDLFEHKQNCSIPNPVYPAYYDANIIAGNKIYFIDAKEENSFLPLPDGGTIPGIIYICSPNNPTGAVYSREKLKLWVDFANKTNSVIIFDAAYESFIDNKDLPHSIFEIPGSETCAIEICSFSKIAGFTGTRCGYTIISKKLVRENMNLNEMWKRRQATKFNGVAYVVQRAAEAVFSEKGLQEIFENINYYKENAKILSELMDDLKIFYTGGTNSPYIWFKCPKNMDSWSFFDFLLKNTGIIGTPGIGFGKNGENYFRFSAFGSRDDTIEATKKFKELFYKA